jgi:hypothetical protein
MVCDTVVATVPKAVVHCLVRKAEKNLLNHLFGFVHKMGPEELARMLKARARARGGAAAAAAASVPSASLPSAGDRGPRPARTRHATGGTCVWRRT